MNELRGGTRAGAIAILFVAAFVAALWWLPLAAALGLGAVFALIAVTLFRRPAARNAALVVTSVLVGLTGFELAFGLIEPPPRNFGVVKVHTPSDWSPIDATLGYRPRPGTTVDVIAKYGEELLYHQTYTIEPSGARRTPGSADRGPTYLFLGDSFMFGEGVADDETIPSQFARLLETPAHVVNLGVRGYGPNHLVRALEAGLYDPYVVGKVAAVVTWIIPQQIERVIGDGSWLTLSPRYVLESDGRVRHTGNFLEHRLTNPAAGAMYLARTRIGWVARATRASMEREQAELYVALIARLKELVQEKFGAPLILIYHWPDEVVEGAIDLDYLPIFNTIKAMGMPMVSARKIIGANATNWHLYFFSHDGHPNARLNRELAKALHEQLGH